MHHKVAAKGQYPTHADCSAFATWCLKNGLDSVRSHFPDIVNGTDWQSGWTGTLARHGVEVAHEDDAIHADLVFYGPGPNFSHVAVGVIREHGKLYVVSNGSEGGPYYEPFDYRPDVGQIRRYI